MKKQSYKELIVWQRGIELVIEVYELTKKLPRSEEFGLSSQMRRAAIAIPSNIAEGYYRKNLKEYIQYLYISLGSAAELETQLVISKQVFKGLEYDKADALLEEVLKMLSSLIGKVQKFKTNNRRNQ